MPAHHRTADTGTTGAGLYSPHSRGGGAHDDASAASREQLPTADYARLEARIVARDQVGASQALYGLIRAGRPVTEVVRETVRIHAPYTHVPYPQRLDDGVVKFVNNDHCPPSLHPAAGPGSRASR